MIIMIKTNLSAETLVQVEAKCLNPRKVGARLD